MTWNIGKHRYSKVNDSNDVIWLSKVKLERERE